MSMFEKRGAVTQVAATLAVFRSLEPGDWVSVQDLRARVEELTETDVSPEAVQSAAWRAGEILVREGGLGVDWHMGGYRRQDPRSLAEATEVRLDRAVADLRRMDVRAVAALSQPDLPAPWRNRLEQLRGNGLRQAALSARRRGKRRPQLGTGEAV